MAFSTDLYVERRSWLHSMDPRIKVVYVLLGTVAILLFRNILAMLAVLLVTQAAILSGRVPKDRVAWVWKRMLPINILIPALFVVFYPEGPALVQAWLFRLTWLALVRGLALALRLDTIAFLVFSWIFTTDQTRIVRSLVRLGLPFNGGLVVAISLRYIPTFINLYGTVADAQQARALDLTRGSFLKRVRQHIPILVAMIISSLRTADRLAKALESRALGLEGNRRTCRQDIHFRPVDYAYLGLVLLAFAAALVLRFGLGAGTQLVSPLPLP